MGKLIDSSGSTFRWLSKIKSIIHVKVPSLTYRESKHWASIHNPETGKNIVYFHPTSNGIMLFTKLNHMSDGVLQPSPSSKQWKAYPSVYTMRSEDDIDKAVQLIINSYLEDKKEKRKKQNQ